MIRGRADGRPDLMWWYGEGDEQRPYGYEYPTENLSTTDATENLENNVYPGYHGYQTYRIPRSYGLRQYYYPVRRRSRRRVAPFTMPYGTVYGAPNQAPQPQIPQIPPFEPHYPSPPRQVSLKNRRRSRRSLLQAQKHRSDYTVETPAETSRQQHPLIRRKHKMFVYSGTVPTDVEDVRGRPKVYWRKIKKTPGRGEVITWCREEVESETSNDGKSVRSSYSRLSVDVTNEMEAMNRDIETILSRYESSFDHNVLQELEEHRLGRKKKVKQEVITKNVQSPSQRRSPPIAQGQKKSPPPLTEEQMKILSMEKPPLDRLAEIPIEYLTPRPPSPPRVQSNRETSEMTNKGVKRTEKYLGADKAVPRQYSLAESKTDAVWRTMLHDLLGRGVLNHLDEASLNKFQSTLHEMNGRESRTRHRANEDPPRTQQNLPSHHFLAEDNENCSPESKTFMDADYVTLSSGARIPNLREGSGLPNPVELKEFAKPVESARIPALVERSGDYLPLNKVDDHSNWRKTIDEIREVSLAHCEKCKSLAEQLHEFTKGAAGDKFPLEDKFVNDKKEVFKDDLAKISSRDFSCGDRSSCSTLPKPASTSANRRESYSYGNSRRGVPGILSTITVNTALTDRTKPSHSETTVNSTTTEESVTNPSSSTELKGGIGVMVEDVGNEEEVPLQRKLEQRTLENTRLWSTTSKIPTFTTTSAIPTPQRKRPNTPTSYASIGEKKSENRASTEAGESDRAQGCGDTRKPPVEKRRQEISSLVDDICSGNMKTTDLNRSLAELNKRVNENTTLLDTGLCISIIRKLIHIMLASEPVLENDRRPTDPFIRILELRKHHMQHIESELNHIEQTENDSSIKARIKGYCLPQPLPGRSDQ